MAYELRGSLTVYIILVITSPFTPFWRNSTFLFLTAYSFVYDSDVLLNIPFYAGALLADLSLVVNANNFPTLRLWSGELRIARLQRFIINRWPIMLAIFAFFVGSCPPFNADRTAWSRFIVQLFAPLIRPGCMYISLKFTDKT